MAKKEKIIKFEFKKGYPFGIPLSEIIPKILPELKRELEQLEDKERFYLVSYDSVEKFLNYLEEIYE